VRVLLISLLDDQCLGLRSISALLKARGHVVRLAHICNVVETSDEDRSVRGYFSSERLPNSQDVALLSKVAQEFKPGLIGLSVYSAAVEMAETITQAVRAVCPVPVVWGGIDPTINPERAIQIADIVCVGEGEEAAVELADHIQAGCDYSAIANLWVRTNGSSGPVQRNPPRPLNQSLDSLPWQDVDLEDAYYIANGRRWDSRLWQGHLPGPTAWTSMYPLQSSRGCPYDCSYCPNALLRELYGNQGFYRERSVGSVLDEIEDRVRRYPGIASIHFWDDVFAVRTEWLKEFSQEYPRRIGLPFTCYQHPNVINPQRVALLKHAGVAAVCLGVQSGSERIRRQIYHRNTPNRAIVEAVQLFLNAGITLFIDMIACNPDETEEDQRETLELLLALPKGFQMPYIYDLVIFDNYPIVAALEDRGHQLPWNARHTYARLLTQPDHIFWRAIWHLAQFPSLSPDTVRSLSNDPYLRGNPEIVESLAGALLDATYHRPSGHTYKQLVSRLEREMASLHGSRLVRAALQLRKWLRRLRKSGGRGAGGGPEVSGDRGLG